MKQKLVVKVSMHDAKSRTKAMKIAAVATGVTSTAITGAEKDQLEIVGEGVDSVDLTRSLRKRMGKADLVSVAPVGEKKEETKKGEAPSIMPMTVWPYQYQPTFSQPLYVHDNYNSYDNGCSIM